MSPWTVGREADLGEWAADIGQTDREFRPLTCWGPLTGRFGRSLRDRHPLQKAHGAHLREPVGGFRSETPPTKSRNRPTTVRSRELIGAFVAVWASL